LLEQFVAANPVAGLFGQRNGKAGGSVKVHTGGRGGKKTSGLLVRFEQPLDPLAQGGVTRAGLIQIGRALIGGQLKDRVQDGYFGIKWFGHR
jgi:hypothetical protein